MGRIRGRSGQGHFRQHAGGDTIPTVRTIAAGRHPGAVEGYNDGDRVPRQVGGSDPSDHGWREADCADHGHRGREEFVIYVGGILIAGRSEDCCGAVGGIAG